MVVGIVCFQIFMVVNIHSVVVFFKFKSSFNICMIRGGKKEEKDAYQKVNLDYF